MKKSKTIQLDDIARLSTKMERRLNAIKNDRRESNEIIEVRTALNILIRAFLSLLHQEDIVKSKADTEIFMRLQENFGRMMKILDDKEEKVSSILKQNKMGIVMNNETLTFISEMESILSGDIYYSIKRALERNPKDAREFMYHIYEILSVSIGVFGSEGRIKGKASSTAKPELNLTAKTLLSDKGQDKLNNDFDSRFKGFEDLKIAESVFGGN